MIVILSKHEKRLSEEIIKKQLEPIAKKIKVSVYKSNEDQQNLEFLVETYVMSDNGEK